MGMTEVLSTRLFTLGLVLRNKYASNNAQELTHVYLYLDSTVHITLLLCNTHNMQFYLY